MRSVNTYIWHIEEQERQAQVLTQWKADKAVYDADYEEQCQTVCDLKDQLREEKMNQKLEYQELKKHAHVEDQSFSNVLTDDDTYVFLWSIEIDK